MKRRRQRERERHADDVVLGCKEDGEVSDDAPLTRADISKIVEAMMNQFPNGGASKSKQEQEGGDHNPHLDVPSVTVSQLNEAGAVATAWHKLDMKLQWQD